ncbi:toll/interleukin-1 receptor domain-containing protein [Sorangium sp. So ce118]
MKVLGRAIRPLTEVRTELATILTQLQAIHGAAVSLVQESRAWERWSRSNAGILARYDSRPDPKQASLEQWLEQLQDKKERARRDLELWVDISFDDDTGPAVRAQLFPSHAFILVGGGVASRVQQLSSDVKCLLEEASDVERRLTYFKEPGPDAPPPAEKVALTASPARERVFIACSHQNDRWLERLKMHLVTFVRKDALDVWDETHIEAGTMWREEVAAAVSRSSLAVLLISVEFIASDLIASNVLPPILRAQSERGLAVVPLFVSPCTLPDELSAFHGLNTLESSLDALPLVEADLVFLRLVELIKKRQFGGA